MRICKKCGWEYPDDQAGTKCKICSTPFEEVVCHICGKLVSGTDMVPGRALCRACHNAEEREHMQTYLGKMHTTYETLYSEWIKRISKLPRSYPTLTEAQWMQACQHFKGCALCGSSHIDARGFFIPFRDGGRYCNWNVLPICTNCANKNNTSHTNGFMYLIYADKSKPLATRKAVIEKILKYLGGILDESDSSISSTK